MPCPATLINLLLLHHWARWVGRLVNNNAKAFLIAVLLQTLCLRSAKMFVATGSGGACCIARRPSSWTSMSPPVTSDHGSRRACRKHRRMRKPALAKAAWHASSRILCGVTPGPQVWERIDHVTQGTSKIHSPANHVGIQFVRSLVVTFFLQTRYTGAFAGA